MPIHAPSSQESVTQAALLLHAQDLSKPDLVLLGAYPHSSTVPRVVNPQHRTSELLLWLLEHGQPKSCLLPRMQNYPSHQLAESSPEAESLSESSPHQRRSCPACRDGNYSPIPHTRPW